MQIKIIHYINPNKKWGSAIDSNTTVIKTVENVEYEIERAYSLDKTINEIIESEMIKNNQRT